MKKKIIYWIKGPSPTDKQVERAAKVGAIFRNASAQPAEEPLEACDAVMGGKNIPAGYHKMEGVEILTSDEEKQSPAEPTAKQK